MGRFRISGVVLAGGQNRRFGGKIKAMALIGGIPVIERITGTIRGIFDEIIIVTNSPEEFANPDSCLIVKDIFINKGPLGGIHAAMNASSCEYLFVIAGDMPFPERILIESQILFLEQNEPDVIIPAWRGDIEPLHGLYRTTLKNKLELFLKTSEKISIRDFIKELNVRYFELPDDGIYARAFININTPSEAEDADRMMPQ
jgi:molybdopterin-guanine dinucleotide biosynthesis protein A